MYSPPAIQDVDELVSLSEQIWRNLALHHPPMVTTLQWMGAVKMRVQTADKNTTNDSVHQLTPFEEKCL